ncbi:MAG: ABC transporter substrate-binding protein [Acidimicrobiia bacterium]|nr:ABC transporter substrate-binding protein [Acidimicrobiia bacterium]MDH4308580.1 ABC transporter substrate-binding protein [Acidimicrobiia bacterium]MDH5293716.1 ABC transporter substrate-binding protein [Acidimicrobiia bacterium]
MNWSVINRVRRRSGALENEVIDHYVAGKITRREFIRRGSVLGLGMTSLGAIVAACGDSAGDDTGGSATTTGDGTATTAAAAGSIQQGGTLRIAAQRPGSPLDPVAMDNIGSYTPVVLAFEYLCGPDGFSLVPMLAESWSPNDDGSVWTFNIRQGVKWHQGGELTAADVVASLDRLAGANLSSYIDPGSAVAVDDHTVEVTLKNPDGQFPYQLSPYNPQALITPADYELGTLFDQKPNGTSAFKLESYDVATGAKYVRFDDYWDGPPNLDGLELLFSDDNATQINGLLGGQADAIIQFGVSDAEAIFASDAVTVDAIRGAGHRQIWFNVREGTFAGENGAKIREAVALGIDRQALVDTVLQGRGDIGNDHPIAPAYEYFDASQPQRERDIDRAKALLEEAGAAGLALTMHAPELQEIALLAEVVQSQLTEIGLNITLNVESTSTFYEKWCKVYDSTNPPGGCDGGEEFGIVDYGNRATPDRYLVAAYATGEWNSAHYNSEEFNAAVAAYQATVTLEDRKEAIKPVQEIANRDIPYVIPYFYNTLTAYAKNVTGVVHTGLGHYYVNKGGFTA